MTLDPHRLIDHDFPETSHVLTPRDASLYALGVGLGDDPMGDDQLRHVYEGHEEFRAVPTQPVTMGFFRWVLTPEFGIDVARVLHGEERLTLHGVVPTEGEIRAKLRILGVEDKGEGRGAVVSTMREIRRAGSPAAFATVETTTFLRGDGGCGNAGEIRRLTAPLPERAPDNEERIDIRPDAALIYRLSGDYNPLHIDPAYAARASFAKPILHGLCTFAMATRPIWSRLEAPARLGQVACRFSGVAFPGEPLTLSLWNEPDGVRFRARSGERTVIDQGKALIEAGA